MGSAEIISFEEVRARKQWDALRRQIHRCFEQWLDGWEAQLHEPTPTLAQVTETVWHLRQALTSGLRETIVTHAHGAELQRQQSCYSQCERLLHARAPVARTVDTMVGSIELEQPYFSCRTWRQGVYPLDNASGVTAGRTQRDIPKAAAGLATEVPYDEAQALLSHLTGVGLGSERMHTVTNHVAAGLTVWMWRRHATRSRGASLRWPRAAFAVRSWWLGLMGRLCQRVLSGLVGGARVSSVSGPAAPYGTASGEMPRAFAFT